MNKATQTLGLVLSIVSILTIGILLVAVAFFAGRGCAARPTETPTPTPPWPTRVNTSTPLPPRDPTATSTQAPTTTPTFTPTPSPTPTSTPTPTLVVTLEPPKLEGKLITVSQDFQVTFTHEYETKPDWWPLPWFKNKFILRAVGTVNAGIDLDRIGDENIVIDEEKVIITLPPPEIFDEPTLDLDETYVLDDLTFRPFKPDWNEAIEAQRKAKQTMLDWALEHGLLETARKSAEQHIEVLVLRLGFSAVEIKWQEK